MKECNWKSSLSNTCVNIVIIGISILLKIVGNLMPKNARDDVIGGPRGRGRPRKAVKRRS
jgi:hypothetical protein